MSFDLDSKLEKIIRGQVQYKSQNLGCNLLIARLQRKYSSNSVPDELKSCLVEFNAFFEKYKNITAKDIEEIQKL